MRHFRHPPLTTLRRGLVIVLLAAATPSFAQSRSQPRALGAATLGRAREAWDGGDFDTARPLFNEALEAGSLSPEETLTCYVYLGSSLSVMGKKKEALAAFRRAATISSDFTVPPEAGKKTQKLAAQARKEQAPLGRFEITGTIPTTSPAGQVVHVEARLDAAHARLVPQVGLLATDSLSHEAFEGLEPASTTVRFDIPARFVLAGAKLLVRIAAQDAHNNRLAVFEREIAVDAAKIPWTTPPPLVEAKPAARATGGAASNSVSEKTVVEKKPKGFWGSPWPYLIGGAAIGAGAAVYVVTRPADEVNVGTAHVQFH